MTESIWDRIILRAEQLAAKETPTKELLAFYVKLLQAQKEVYDGLRSRKDWLPSGNLEQDLPVVRPMLSLLLHAVEKNGPAALAGEAYDFANASYSDVDQALIKQWRNPSDMRFFEKALLQPYSRWLADCGGQPLDRNLERQEGRCRFCAGKPQVSILRTVEVYGESGGRYLLCATCLTVWLYRRVVCPNCAEERPAKLGYFHSEEFDYIRVEACDTCRHYINVIDLTRFGLAMPLVDEIAAAPLDLWAREHGYTKIELNLVGL